MALFILLPFSATVFTHITSIDVTNAKTHLYFMPIKEEEIRRVSIFL